MKKKILILLFVLALLFVLVGCKKEPDNGKYIQSENDIRTKYEEHFDALPTSLNSLDYLDKKGNIVKESFPVDNYGNEYEYGYYIGNSLSHDYYATYYLAGEYNKFSGVCILPYDLRTTDSGSCFEIYGDSKLLFKSDKTKAGCKPQYFEIDINGVEYLTIFYPEGNGISELATICDGIFEK